MIKLTFCVCRRDDISEEEFHDYWLNKHGPLVKSVAESCAFTNTFRAMPSTHPQMKS